MHDIQPYDNARNPGLAGVVQALAFLHEVCSACHISRLFEATQDTK